MKYLLLLFTFLIIQTVAAQDIDSTLVFETEQVAEFKKQTILEEFQVPYSVDEQANFMLRFAINNFSRLTKSNINNLRDNNFMEMMAKVGVANALTVGIWGRVNGFDPTTHANPFVSFRHFLGMKKLVNDKKQKPNFTGRYVSFSVGYNIFSGDTNERDLYTQTTNITRQDDGLNLRLNYGTQFGSMFDMSIEGGLKSYFSTQTGANGLLEMPTSQGRGLMPYIATVANLTDGYVFSKNQTSCEFLNCFREADKFFKIGLNDLIYADPTIINTNANIAYERRIGDSFFSSNSGSVINLGLIKQFVPTGESQEVLSGTRESLPVFSDVSQRNFVATLTLFQELRFYAFQKSRITNGNSAKNFSDFYLTSIASYQQNLGDKLVLFTNAKDATNENNVAFGLGAGQQIVAASKYFFDLQGLVFFANTNGFTSPNIQIKLAVGFVK